MSANADKQKANRQAGARSHDELAAQLLTAIDKDDVKAIRALMAPVALLEPHDVFSSQRDKQLYETFRKHAPSIASAYRKHLVAAKLLPLRGKTIQPLIELEKTYRTKAGTLRTSTGIFLLNADGTVHVELAEQAVAINGRWFIVAIIDPRRISKYLPPSVARQLNVGNNSN